MIRIGPPDPSQSWGVTAGSLAFALGHGSREQEYADRIVARWWSEFSRAWRRIGKAMPK